MPSQPGATGTRRWVGVSQRTLMVWRLLSAIMLLVMGGIHLYLVLDSVHGLLGVLFVLNAVGALVLAIAILVLHGRLLSLATVLSLLFMVGTLLALVLALTVGLFGIHEVLSFKLVPTTLVVESIGTGVAVATGTLTAHLRATSHLVPMARRGSREQPRPGDETATQVVFWISGPVLVFARAVRPYPRDRSQAGGTVRPRHLHADLHEVLDCLEAGSSSRPRLSRSSSAARSAAATTPHSSLLHRHLRRSSSLVIEPSELTSCQNSQPSQNCPAGTAIAPGMATRTPHRIRSGSAPGGQRGVVFDTAIRCDAPTTGR
jgi:hypothetical protein